MNLATASLYTMLALLASGLAQESDDAHTPKSPSLPPAVNGWQIDAAIVRVSPSAALDRDGPVVADTTLVDARRELTDDQWHANHRLPLRTARRPSQRTSQPMRSARSRTNDSPRVEFPSASLPSAEARTALLRSAPSTADDDYSFETGVAVEPAARQPRELNRQQIALRNQVRQALRQYFPKQLNTRENNCWEVMHSIVGYGTETLLHRGGPNGELVNAIGYLCWNGPCIRDQLLYIDQGNVAGRKGPRVQGHHGQFLAILAQSHVSADYPLRVEGREFTVADLVEFEKRSCRPRTELTFKLIALAHYVGTDPEWQSDDGQTWSVSRLIQEELAQPVRGVACGGTHRMMGFSYALRKREMEGGEISGQFARARQFVDDYHKYTFALQNRDGSFSTAWFEHREARPDLTRRLQTSGHILEWMAFSVPDEMIDDPRVVRAVDYVSGILVNYPDHPWEIGHLGHALHALAIYDRRAFGSTFTAPPYGVAAHRHKVGRDGSTVHRRQQPSPNRSTWASPSRQSVSAAAVPRVTAQRSHSTASMPPAVAAAQRHLRSHRAFTRTVDDEPSVKLDADSGRNDPSGETSDDDASFEPRQETEAGFTGPALFPTP